MSLSSLEQSLREYPLLRRILSELEPYDFRNLLLAGAEMPMSRASANKFLIRRICEICGHTNDRERVYPCIGCYAEPCNINLQDNIENRWSQKLTVNEPHGVEVCHGCIPSIAWARRVIDWLPKERLALLKTKVQTYFFMCKEHCLENFNPSLGLPPAQCGCPAFLEEGNNADEQGRVRCLQCFGKTHLSLHFKAAYFKTALRYRQTTTTFADSFEYSGTEPSLEETCCMLDCKEKIWDDVHNPAFSVFCPSCVTVFDPKVDGTAGRKAPEECYF